MTPGKVQVWRSPKDGQWRWSVRASNGRVTADSAEGYRTRRACVNGALSTLRTLLAAAPELAREMEKGKRRGMA
jgi:uncharacterized protein YegP (UPF0339 family)